MTRCFLLRMSLSLSGNPMSFLFISMQAALSKQKGKLFYFLRNSPYSHSANADIIALYLLVSSNREEKVSCASR